MDIRHFIGIDVSKNTLDWAVYATKGIIWQTQSENSPLAIRAIIKQLLALPDFQIANCVVCMEHTGLYNAHALEVLFQAQLPIWLEASLHIKQAGGLQRGKLDSIDAQRIADRVAGAICLSLSRPDSALEASSTRHEKAGGIYSASSASARYDQPVEGAFSRTKTIW